MSSVDAVSPKSARVQRSLSSIKASFLQACAFSAAAALSGCAVLSNDGPSAASIQSQAAVYESAATDKATFDYVLLDIDSKAVSIFGTPPATSLYGTFGHDKGPAPEIRVGVGDVLQLTVFESQSGGLFIPKDAGARPGNYVTLPPQVIDRPGTLTVPYAERVVAVGKTIRQLEQEINRQLASRAIDPQAVITLVSRSSSTATLIGAFTTPSKIEVGPKGERLLDMIAKANGVTAPGYETYITVQRDKRKATVFFDTILANSDEDIFIKPGDIIYAYREPHRYVAFGAVLTQGQIDFGASKLSLAEAVARASGLDDARADPHEVFLYRVTPRSLLERADLDLSKFPASQKAIPVIFRANMRDAASYFAAIKFLLADKDVLYVSNSMSHEFYKFLTLLNNTTQTAASVPADIKAAGNAIKSLNK